jgi:hypothetical protein
MCIHVCSGLRLSSLQAFLLLLLLLLMWLQSVVECSWRSALLLLLLLLLCSLPLSSCALHTACRRNK